MNSKNENFILLIIKYTPPIFIITLSLIISITLYLNNQKTFDEEKKQIEKEYIQNNKELIKTQVDNVYEYILKEQKDTENRLKHHNKQRVYQAYNIAKNIYEQNKNLDEKTLKKIIIDALRTIRFSNNKGYFFIYEMKGKNILNAAFPQIEGKEFWNYKDAKGTLLIQEMNKILKIKDETFYDWYWYKPNDKSKKQYKKVGFFKKFEPYNWFIGTGEYLEDFENDIKKQVINHIQTLKYKKNGYIFVLDYEGNYLSHIRKEVIGLNALEVKDTRSHKTITEAITLAKNTGHGYIYYIQNKKPGTNAPVKKTSYIRGIQKWEWFIGKGFYEDDTNEILKKKRAFLDKKLNENLQDLIITSILLTILLLFISIYISKILEKKFKIYRDEIKTNLKEITTQHDILAKQSKLAAIGEMMANIAHQWRQPLSMISSAATGLRLKKEVGALSDEEFNKSLDYINNSTQYLSKTIDDFRNFFSDSKEKTLFSIKSAIEETINILNTQLDKNKITIIQDINNSEILGVKNELIQVLINILNNSKDELLKSRKDNRLIIINTYEKDETLFIEIKDNAGGVRKKVLPYVFEPYFTTKHKSKGTGIGLYMSQQIILRHYNGLIDMSNCVIEYENKVYKGAKVCIKLSTKNLTN